MIELHPGGLPAPSESVLAALRGIHPGLFIVRSRYALNQQGQVVVDPKTQEPIEIPRYWVWIDHRGAKSPLFPIETPEGDYMPCDMRIVRRVGTDLGIATRTFGEMCSALDQQEEAKEEKRQKSESERFRRFVENNGPAWRRAMDNLRNGVAAPRAPRVRDPVIYGYDGQAVRSSHFNSVPLSAREMGIDTEN
jgi:hypothetical protein